MATSRIAEIDMLHCLLLPETGTYGGCAWGTHMDLSRDSMRKFVPALAGCLIQTIPIAGKLRIYVKFRQQGHLL